MWHQICDRVNENQLRQRESKRVKIENDSNDDWARDFDIAKVINTYHTFVKKTKVWRYVFRNDERQAGVKWTKQIENDRNDDWVLYFDMDKVINA
jgi:hypothetical protein